MLKRSHKLLRQVAMSYNNEADHGVSGRVAEWGLTEWPPRCNCEPHPLQVQALYRPPIGYSQLIHGPLECVVKNEGEFDRRRHFEWIEENAPDGQAQNGLPSIMLWKSRIIARTAEIGDER